MKNILLLCLVVCFSFALQAQTLNGFNHTFNGEVRCIAVTSDRIYVGGTFSTIDGTDSHHKVAAFDLTTHALLSWNAWFNDHVDCITVSPTGDTIFVGGEFTFSGNGAFSNTRNGLAAYDKNGNLLGWNPNPGSYILSLVVKNNTLYVGGNFSNISGTSRNRLAAFSLSDMSLTSWNPNVSTGTVIQAIAASATGDTIYAGGSFSQVNGSVTRNNLASFNNTDGTVTDWNPDMSNVVSALAISENTLVVGGSFTTVSGGTTTRNYLASFNASTGSVTSWDPAMNQVVDAVAIKGSIVYASGNFTTVNGGTTRNFAAAFDTSSSTSTSWNPNSNGRAKAIAVTSTEIFIGGSFSTVLGTGRQSAAGMDDPNNVALPVELSSFSASVKQGSVELSWKTATEVNNNGFEIERAAISNQSSAISWSKIGFVEGNGTTNAPKEYSFVDHNLSSGSWSYRLKQIDRDGKFEYSQSVEVTIVSMPKVFALEQNYPNPFNPSTVISYQLPANSHVTLKVYDAIGREIATLVNEVKEAGSYSATFDASQLSSGIYFARLQSNGKQVLKKMVMMK